MLGTSRASISASGCLVMVIGRRIVDATRLTDLKPPFGISDDHAVSFQGSACCFAPSAASRCPRASCFATLAISLRWMSG